MFNGQGGTAFSFRNPGEPDTNGVERVHGRATTDRDVGGPGDLLFMPRLASSFDLTDQQTLVLGASARVRPERHRLRPAHANLRRGYLLEMEAGQCARRLPVRLVADGSAVSALRGGRRPDGATPLPSETLRDWGFYSQVLWGFKQRWVAGLRGEYVERQPRRVTIRTMSSRPAHADFAGPDLLPQRVLQDPAAIQLRPRRRCSATEHSVWLQFEFLLGAHGAHKF